MGKLFDAIDNQIIKPRVVASEDDGFRETKKDISSFYAQGSPKRYRRTHAYEDSPNSTGVVSEGNGNYNYKIYLKDHEYDTGTPGFPVFQEIQHNGSGILGKSGTWDESQEDIIQAIKDNFR